MGLQSLFAGILTFINTILFPVLMAFALLIFLWNMMRYFVIGGSNEEDQTKAKSIALWGILAFIIISGFWGIINIFGHMFGLNTVSPLTPDYKASKGGFYDDRQPGANLASPDDGILDANGRPCTIFALDGSCAGAQNIPQNTFEPWPDNGW